MFSNSIYKGQIKCLKLNSINAVRNDEDTGYCIYNIGNDEDFLLIPDDVIPDLRHLIEVLYFNYCNTPEE